MKGDIQVLEKEAGLGGSRYGNFWLIVRNDSANGITPQEILTLGVEVEAECDTERAARTLPVFSFEEEALLFLRLSGLEAGWRAKKSSAMDLAAALSDAYPYTRRVALDPIPEFGPHRLQDLVSIPLEEFVGLLANGR